MKGYETGRMPMKSGICEVEERRFKKVQGKERLWFIAIQENPADNIYVYNPKNTSGFGGSVMEFTLEDGSIEKVEGPWHSNSDALFDDTGMDVRDMYLTKVILGLSGIKYQGGHAYKMQDVIYQEDDYKLGKYKRGEELAQKKADEMGVRVHFWIESMGGAHGFFKDPVNINDIPQTEEEFFDDFHRTGGGGERQ